MYVGNDPIALAAPARSRSGLYSGYRRPAVIDGRLVPAVLAAAGGGTPVAAIERQAGAPAVLVRPVVLHLLWSGALVTDLGLPLRSLSVVRPREEAAA